ncbi:MAG TPA: histidine phosphatase family protein [Rhizomicrobium sp.]|jgi:probable phosphoglycerate mutase|nr:histidine phosphatase family protein [Rhizomicrobium sp.]
MSLRLKDSITLYFARHGETEANREKRFSGWMDTPLTDKGRAQAHAVGDILKREVGPRPPLAFVSSPLLRARSTMEIVCAELDLPPDGYTTDARIAEIDLGAWDQLTDAEARARDPALFDARAADKWHVRVPDGENYEEVAARATDWIMSLSADTFAVSHGALTRILRGLFLGLPWQGMSTLDEPQGVIFRVRGAEVVRLD